MTSVLAQNTRTHTVVQSNDENHRTNKYTCPVFGVISVVHPIEQSTTISQKPFLTYGLPKRKHSHIPKFDVLQKLLISTRPRLKNSTMWNVLCLLMVALVGVSYQRAPVLFAGNPGGYSVGELSPSAFNDYVNWWQNIIGIISNNEDTAAAEPAITPVDQSTCPPCTCGALGKKNRIVGGVPTYMHQYPWMAMLTYKGKFYCGASLINHKYVMTAAHCVHGFDGKNIGVRLLEHDRSNNDEAKHIDLKVLRVIKHKGYSPNSYNNDIALLRMDTEGVEFGPNTGINPVCLPVEGKSFAGYEGVITGWGAKKQGGSSSQILHEVYVPIMSNDDCRKTEYDEKRITANMICAGYPEGKKDSCQGDSGGPMHIANNTAYHIVGVVSWGEGCAQANRPGVYSRVNRYLNWVANNTMDACPCTNIYTPAEGSTY